MMRSKKGVTLIALIVTVIILLIIAGVSIGKVLEDEVITKAQNTIDRANDQTKQTKEQEENLFQNDETKHGRKSPTQGI